MEITPESRVGDIAASHPLATRVFARHGIDFCCGGGVALRQACAKRGLDAPALLSEIEREVGGEPAPATDWREAPLEELVRHIVDTYHRPLHEELPRLEAMARKVAQVHAERDPERRLPAIVADLTKLAAELENHMMREERVLFPMLLSGFRAAPVHVFVDDHAEAGEALARLRELTDGYVPPADACNTWRALWAGLAALEADTHQHIHLENNVLFPRATQAAGVPV